MRRKLSMMGTLAMVAMLGMAAITGCKNSQSTDTDATTVTQAAESSQETTTAEVLEKYTWTPENTSTIQTTQDAMENLTAQQAVDAMTIGWNLGDTLDVCNADRDGDGSADETSDLVDETLWGNVMTTKALIDQLKADGVNAIRIPVTWRDHIGDAPNYEIDSAWMDRVEEVVRYAYDNGMYVILNVHHDGGGDPAFGAWIRNASSESQRESVLNEYGAIWQQIANRFQNYSDHLIFESMNEVGFDDLDESSAFDLLNQMNQIFVDLIRQSAGNNPERHLLIAGYWTDIEKTCSDLYKMPTDTIENHLILSVHYYTPWQFCTTNQQDTWGSSSDVSQMEGLVNDIYEKYTQNGVPVLVGEYGFGDNDPASCVYFAENFVKLCHDKGIATYLWDNGRQFDRVNLKWNNQNLIEALQRAVSGDDYTVTKAE